MVRLRSPSPDTNSRIPPIIFGVAKFFFSDFKKETPRASSIVGIRKYPIPNICVSRSYIFVPAIPALPIEDINRNIEKLENQGYFSKNSSR